MALKLTNNAVGVLAAPITASATTLALNPGSGAKFPSLGAGDWFPLVVIKVDGTLEIMRCTGRSADTLTVVRAQEGTAAVAFAAGDRVELRLTAAACDEIASIQDGEVTTSKLADGVLSADADGRAKMADQFVTFLKTAPDLRAFLVPTGGMIMWTKSTVPTGFVEANGAALPIASYQDLANAMYVGDANNATAPAWYKCTNPSNPSGSRSTSGSYIVVPDMRGEFPRGWDNGRGVDSGRALCSSQADQNKAHNHGGGVGSAGQHSHTGVTDWVGDHQHTIPTYARDGVAQANKVADSGSGRTQTATTDAAGGHNHTFTTSTDGGHVHPITSDGGTEARPRNVAVMFIIKT